MLRGTVRRAEVLGGPTAASPVATAPTEHATLPTGTAVTLRTIYDQWVQSKPRSADSVAACGRSLKLFEAQFGSPPLQRLTHAHGEKFRNWLITERTTSKTARDRLNWIKVLLNYAALSVNFYFKNPWPGLDIRWRTTLQRQPWSDAHLSLLFDHEIWRNGRLPSDTKAGGIAAYWIPLLALYTGARCSEICQLRTSDVCMNGTAATIRITDEGTGQRVKTQAGHRNVPIHSELVRLGFLDYVKSVKETNLWPLLPQREGKAGGYFSHYFGELRRSLGIPPDTVFHSFRHSVRTKLVEAHVAETVIDRILGHESSGSVGARVYTHVSPGSLQVSIETLHYQCLRLTRMQPYISNAR